MLVIISLLSVPGSTKPMLINSTSSEYLLGNSLVSIGSGGSLSVQDIWKKASTLSNIEVLIANCLQARDGLGIIRFLRSVLIFQLSWRLAFISFPEDSCKESAVKLLYDQLKHPMGHG